MERERDEISRNCLAVTATASQASLPSFASIPLSLFHSTSKPTRYTFHHSFAPALGTMTTLNPSHNVFRHPAGRHAQAVHEPSPSFPDQLPSVTKEDDDLSIDSDLDERDRELLRAKREARRRVQGAMPPMPDLRFEQVGLGLCFICSML